MSQLHDGQYKYYLGQDRTGHDAGKSPYQRCLRGIMYR